MVFSSVSMNSEYEKFQDGYVSISSSPLKDYWSKSNVSFLKNKKRRTLNNKKEVSIFWGLIKVKW